MTDGAARRDRTCLVLLVEQVRSLDHQRRVSCRAAEGTGLEPACSGSKPARFPFATPQWITRESNTEQTAYQTVQGHQPVVIQSSGSNERESLSSRTTMILTRHLPLSSRAERESNPR